MADAIDVRELCPVCACDRGQRIGYGGCPSTIPEIVCPFYDAPRSEGNTQGQK